MSTGPSSHDDFFTKLTALFDARRGKEHGSIYLTQKRLTSESAAGSDPLADLVPPPHPLPILVRAHDGASKPSKAHPKKTASKVKVSTVVHADDLESFFTRYADICKTGMSGLKKRDRKKARAKKGKSGKGSAATAA